MCIWITQCRNIISGERKATGKAGTRLSEVPHCCHIPGNMAMERSVVVMAWDMDDGTDPGDPAAVRKLPGELAGKSVTTMG